MWRRCDVYLFTNSRASFCLPKQNWNFVPKKLEKRLNSFNHTHRLRIQKLEIKRFFLFCFSHSSIFFYSKILIFTFNSFEHNFFFILFIFDLFNFRFDFIFVFFLFYIFLKTIFLFRIVIMRLRNWIVQKFWLKSSC